MQDYRKLRVWHRAHALVISTYALCKLLPDYEKYGLASQLRRAVVSIGANIVEGAKRRNRRDYARFLNVALGSASEVECLLHVGRDLQFFPAEEIARLFEETSAVTAMLLRLEEEVSLASKRRRAIGERVPINALDV